MPAFHYIGRFAPSPTGQLHFGTLVAAVASFLQAKTQQGKWLMRIEDVDTLRTVKNADKDILTTLESFGFEWDGEVIYQTNRTELYNAALEQLKKQGNLFPCTCSRSHLRTIETYQTTGVYPGHCRINSFPMLSEHSIRIRSKNIDIKFDDAVMGIQIENIETDCGDFVVKRRDGLFAYQLAVVVDDALQGITEVVRGADLLDSTARQIYLQRTLGYQTPNYLHLPLVLAPDGTKLSKSISSQPLDGKHSSSALYHSLVHLGQNPPQDIKGSHNEEIWAWALQNWEISRIPQTTQLAE